MKPHRDRPVLLPAPYDLAWSGVSLLVFAGGLLYPWVTAATGAALPRCVFKSVTEVPCAGCGSGRSLVAFAHGGFAEAVVMNPLFGLFCLLSAGVVLYTAAVRLFGMKRLHVAFPPSGAWIYPVAIPALILANWAFLVAVGR